MKWLWAPLQSKARNPYVDALRGFSILVVVFAHFSALCGPFTAPWVVPFDFVRAFGRNSCFGVSIFFVVSGFLITTSSIQRFGALGRINLRQFYVYRASRILPLLLLLTAFNLSCHYLGLADFALTPEVPVQRLLGYLFTFRFNVLYLSGGAVLTVWAVLWSLAVEEVFYLGYPLLCRLLRRDAVIVAALAAVVVIGPYLRHREGWSGMYMYAGCFDQLAFGCLAGLAVGRWAKKRWYQRTAPVLLLVGAVAVMGFYFARDAHVAEYFVFAPTAIGTSAAMFLFGSAMWKATAPSAPWWRQGRTLRLLGFLSYELYLFHMPLFVFLKHLTAAVKTSTGGVLPRDVTFVAMLPLLVLFGVVLARHVGQPMQTLVRNALDRSPRREVADNAEPATEVPR